jgi:diamine N-acetyltransferase
METTNITIRYAALIDAEFLSEFGAKAFSQAFGIYNTPEDLADYLNGAFSPEKQAEELARPGSNFLILEVNSVPAGYAHLQESPVPDCVKGKKPVELIRFYLLTEWIGKGIAARLMEACIEDARRRSADVIWLGVWEKNPRAITFYQKWKFQIVGTHSFLLGSDLQQDYLMQRPVNLE